MKTGDFGMWNGLREISQENMGQDSCEKDRVSDEPGLACAAQVMDCGRLQPGPYLREGAVWLELLGGGGTFSEGV